MIWVWNLGWINVPKQHRERVNVGTTAVELDIDTTIRELDQEITCKYLGIEEKNGIQHSKMKEKTRKEGFRQVIATLKTIEFR